MKFVNRHFVEEDIWLDYNEFIDCTMTRCRLFYAGGLLPGLSNVTFDSCNITLVEDADRTAQFIKMLLNYSGEDLKRAVLNELFGLTDTNERQLNIPFKDISP